MNAHNTLTVHQLLGRLVYFHVLFIEPELPPMGRPAGGGEVCCRHSDPVPASDDTTRLRDTAWAAVEEIAATLAATSTCPGEVARCCPTCQVLAAGKAITDCWMDVEHRAYGTPPQPGDQEDWSRAVAVRLAAVFSRQHDSVCAALAGATARWSTVRPPSAERLPLTSELMTLWADPTDRAPVISWLNHCTALTDVAQVLDTRRTSR